MEEILNNIKVYFTEKPHFAYLMLAVVFLVLFIGVLKDKKWAIDPSSSYQRFFYNTFGHNAFRFVIGGIFLLGTIAGIFGFFIYQ